MELKKIKQQYTSYKNILAVIENGDTDQRYQLLINALKVQDVENMLKFVRLCEDIGVNYVN